MRLKILFALAFFSYFGVQFANAQSCRDLYKEAKSFEKQGKLEKAKTKYQQVVKCGDKLYYEDSKERIGWIDRILRKPDPVKPFSISENEVVIPYQGGQDVITVDGNGSWKADLIDGENGWCKIKKEKGKIYIVSDANESNTERSCVVSISMGGKTKKVTVKNEKAPEILIPSVENVTFPYNGETNTVEIHSNTDWDVKDVPGWVVSSKEEGKITLTALANENNIERKADIKIEGASKSVIINIYQGAGLDHLAFSKNDLHFGPDGGDEYINIYTDAEDWRFGDFPHWCQVSKVADNLLRVHCTPNEPINLNREASVNVTTGKQTLGINVSQEAKPFIAMIPNIGIGGRTISFGVSAGYVIPLIFASSGGNYTGSLVNYSLGNNSEEASYSSQSGFSVGAFADMRIYKNLYMKLGVNYTHYSYKNTFDADVTRIISGLEDTYYLKGSQQNKYSEDYTMNLLEIPVIASYRLPVTKISHIQLNVGPVLSYGLSSKMKLSGNWKSAGLTAYEIKNHQLTNNSLGWSARQSWSQEGEFDLYSNHASYTEMATDGLDFRTNTFESDFEESPLNRLNLGAMFGIAYEYAGISLGIEYNLMFTNMANKKYWEGERWKVFRQDSPINMSGYSQHNNNLQIKLGYTFRY